MGVQVSYPGVYIEEFTPAGPITGVGTNTAAFVGVTAKGQSDTPTKITSWEGFKDTFGNYPVSGFYLWYAVKGFFENGGQVCYVVRASNGERAHGELINRGGKVMATLWSRQESPDTLTAAVADDEYIRSGLEVYQPTATLDSAGGKELSVLVEANAAKFRAGDRILTSEGDEVGVVRVSGSSIRVDAELVASYSGGETIQLADINPGDQVVRLSYGGTALPSGHLATGTVLEFGFATSEFHVVQSVQKEYLAGGTVTYRVTLRDAFDSTVVLDTRTPLTVQSAEFSIAVTSTTTTSTTTYSKLSLDSAHERYWVDVINNDASGPITAELTEPPPPVPLSDQRPDTSSSPVEIKDGAEELLTTLSASDFTDAIAQLEAVDDVNLLAVPDCLTMSEADTSTVQQDMIAHCERAFDRFAILDARPGLVPFSGTDASIEDQRQGLDSARGYGALYYPWLRVSPSGSGDPVLVPPSGHVCGVIARSDAARGVHKAPANEIVAGALGVERTMSNIDQGQLNLQGINVIRVFGSGGRPIVWGARTTATDSNWQYINIRRLFLYIEESIQEGIAWALFEPNNLDLWQKLKRSINEFLHRVWRDGGLFGAKAEDAYYVEISEANNPFSEQEQGRLTIEIGLRPTYPAEFIIVRIGIWPGGSEVSES